MALQYPLLFPYGDKGFYVGMRYVGPDDVLPGGRSQGAQPAHLDPLLSYSSTILGRERTIILNLEVRVLPSPSVLRFLFEEIL
jgi:hypothetical protein